VTKILRTMKDERSAMRATKIIQADPVSKDRDIRDKRST
jgi:hypothetical protein